MQKKIEKKNRLQQHFPIIRDRVEVLQKINGQRELREMFASWLPHRQKEFLDFCTGVCGIKFLYDSFFKELLNPEYAPERLEELLSLLLGVRVKILEALPPDSTRIADESSLLIMDIVVQLEDGTIVNLEVQKIGYKFPGERSACYSADLLLRQYKRLRSEERRRKKAFSYCNIKDVHTIVFFEKSPAEFQKFPDCYLHNFLQKSNTGLELNLLQRYIFVPLDIFRKKLHNNGNKVENKLEAWLAFLCVDDPEMILHLISNYPEFEAIYADAYQLCLNIEEVMHMFSKELAELDRNTVQLMIDEMQEEIDKKREQLSETNEELSTVNKELNTANKKLEQVKAEKRVMIRRSFDTLKDVSAAASMLGVSEEEVRQAIQD